MSDKMDVFEEARRGIRWRQEAIERLWGELDMPLPKSYEESGRQAFTRQHFLAEIQKLEEAILYHRVHLPPYAELKDGFLFLRPVARGERLPRAMDPV